MMCDVSVMTSSSHEASKLHVIVQYSFRFPMVKKIYKNPPRETTVIVKNDVASFSEYSVDRLDFYVLSEYRQKILLFCNRNAFDRKMN